VARLVKVKTPTLRRRTLQVLLRTAYTFPFSPTQTSNLLFLVKDTSKPQQNRNTVISMPPKKAAQLGPVALPPSGIPVTPRGTRSTLNLTSKTFDNIINQSVDIDQLDDARPPLQKLCPELMTMILEFALTSDEPVKISKHGRHQMPGVLQVSSEIHATGIKTYYFNNKFRAIVTGKHPGGPLEWATNIASDNLRYIPSFTFDFRLTLLDYRQWYLRLSRTDEENLEHREGLFQMCDDARLGIVKTLFRLRHKRLDMANVRLHVDLVPNDIPVHLRVAKKGLRIFMSGRIALLIYAVEGVIGPTIHPTPTPRNDISRAIRRGRAMRSTHECWDLVVT
jgi:hypothetical protein